MTEERIVRCILMSAASMLFVVGCPPEPPDDSDAGVGGSTTGGTPAMGGNATGGSATGGTATVPVCDTVETLPAQGTGCNNTGESHCDRSGNQCACARGIWYCNTSCASTYPTEPSPYSECNSGTACSYPSGVSCVCGDLTIEPSDVRNRRWLCTGGSLCPPGRPMTGDLCNDFTGMFCDYPPDSTAPGVLCVCSPCGADGGLSCWTCAVSAACPATQPVYSLTDSCGGYAWCRYGSDLCICLQGGTPWCCGTGCFPFPFQS